MFTGIVEEVGRVTGLRRTGSAARLEVACDTVVAGVGIGDSIAVAGCCLTVAHLAPGSDDAAGADAGGADAAVDGGADEAVAAGGGAEAAGAAVAARGGADAAVPGAAGAAVPDAAVAAGADGATVADAPPGTPADGAGPAATATRSGFAADLMAETLASTALGDLAVGDRVNLERALRADQRLGGHLVQGHVDGIGEVVDRVEEPGTVWLEIAAPAGLARYLVAKGSVTVDGASLTVVDVAGSGERPRFRVALIPHTLEVTTFGDRGVGDRVNLEVDVIAKYVERLLAAGADTPYDALQEEGR